MTVSSKDSANVSPNVLPEVPQAIADYLAAIALKDHAPAYLQVTATGHLVSSGGDLQKYGLQAIAIGEYVGRIFYYLEGFFPIERTEVMQHLQLDCGPIVDIHVTTADQKEGAGWVLLLDTTADAQRVQKLQQKGNDLSLLRQQYSKLLSQKLRPLPQKTPMVGQSALAEPPHGSIAQQTVSVLIIKFCGIHASQLSVGKPSTLKAVNAGLSFIMQVIVEEGGLINHVLGGTAAAFFGLLPSQQAAPQKAVYAAKRVLKQLIAEPSPQRLGIGASITSGEAAAGILRSQGYQRLNAVGDPIQAAAQMSSYIRPGTITIDRTTFDVVQPYQNEFQTLSVSPDSISKVSPNMTLYRLKFE